jgi:uncharacterized protein
VATELAEAIELFNSGEFYACHDALEALWIEAPVDEKKFYQGLLQIAVAFYHLGNKNLRGAVVLLGEGRFRLIPYEPSYCPAGQVLAAAVEVQRLRSATRDFLALLQAIEEPSGIDRLLTEISSGQLCYPKI